tara:strand:+ start:144 stop:407 length:264 start_codon:yes stop_codon:yes gene_type:complete
LRFDDCASLCEAQQPGPAAAGCASQVAVRFADRSSQAQQPAARLKKGPSEDGPCSWENPLLTFVIYPCVVAFDSTDQMFVCYFGFVA